MHKSSLAVLLLTIIPAAAPQMHDHRSNPVVKPAQQKGPPEYARFRKEMDAGMGKMMKDMHASGYAGDPDRDFLAMMIPHHEGAVEMARLVLIHGRDPTTRRLAEDIIASQTVEIEGMKRRLAELRTGVRGQEPQFPELGGTRGPPR